MSLPIWTPDELLSERKAHSSDCWRLVEAQHHVSTMKLTDTLREQVVLEQLLEETKPVLPPDAKSLHYLLAAPFRYGAPYPHGSRFRRAGRTPGVFYGSLHPQTAVAEITFHRLLFYAESPMTLWPTNAAEYTAFNAPLHSSFALNLTLPPLSRDETFWSDKQNYDACQRLADLARAAKFDLVIYSSIRDPKKRLNFALLSPTPFVHAKPATFQTWHIKVGTCGAQAVREHPADRLEFTRSAFADDPRIAHMKWDRSP